MKLASLLPARLPVDYRVSDADVLLYSAVDSGSPSETRRALTRIGKKLARTGNLHCEPDLACGEHALIRVTAKCGCFWPWDDGEDEQLARVVWWIGKTAHGSTVLAYGDVADWFEDCAPGYHGEKPRWYPTIDDGYVRLLGAMTDGHAMCSEWEDFAEEVESKTVDGLYKASLDETVSRKAPYLRLQKTLEMMLRVDSAGEEDAGYVVLGTPVWVREPRAQHARLV